MTDLYLLDETTSQIRDTVAAFAAERIAPLADRVDRTDVFPRELWPELGALGILGITADEADGGSGLGYLAHVVASEQVSRASGSIGISYIAHSNLCVNQIRLNGNAAQRKRFLPKLISGEHVGALAMSEAGSGSDVVSMSLKATRRGDKFVLNGTKMWTTNGHHADVYIIYAKTTPDAGKRGITAFIVERNSPGFSQGQKLDKLGMRGSGTCELIFEDCEVPEENVLGKLDGGVQVLMKGLDYERIVASSASIGLMQAALDIALPYVRERKQFGRPIGEFQLVQGKLADMMTSLNAARAYLYTVAAAADRGMPLRKEAASAIMFASERATQVALDAIQLLGGNGYINDFATGRLLRDAKLYEIGAGTTEIRKMLIGRELMEGH
ncbi:isovaleryl-CoA dehydrogenase [Bradyrhizobium sp. NAS80.1]|uniref:isovaleryl-CoA dehydrogenase n=1 Tax=Bradyrhizobium sp. NAS80.1 TaxID=1680159 RepID=UPI000969C27B|nr:isovaleryl-CoA dehydrogenase [Bradyrhizobium sp. NAS80.1]OKO87837.1 isovaleryl-CoA dehydrogenase [Bradyrhizobium sp. NAS80.1]